MGNLSRRQFLKYAGGGLGALVVGSQLQWVLNSPFYAAAQVQSLSFRITDAIKGMVTDNSINPAACYFWIYKSSTPSLPPECPGPTIFATQGDTIQITLTNDLPEPHAFAIPGIVDSGPIQPGQTVVGSFTASRSGAFLYFDNLNSPVNRVMGLHGALVVMPAAPAFGRKFTPYDDPTPAVQKLFDDFGSSAHSPGLAWEQGDSNPASFAPPFRTYLWLLHQASPNLFEEVGSLPAGQIYPAQQFMDAFLRDAFSPTNANRIPQYFTINGQSGFFGHSNPFITPHLRVGEPCVVHVLNAGLMTHSLHLHANHFYVTSVNGVVQVSALWLDTFNIEPMHMADFVIPFHRPPEVPHQRGIGLPDPPLTSLANPLIPGSTPHPVWPPTEELSMFFPAVGTTAGNIDISVQQSPLCYPMHDHSEPSQTSQGGNYNLGLIVGMNFTGDRTTPGGVTTFPNPPDEFPPNATGPAAPPFGH